MADQKDREITLYVQSKKVVTSFYRPPTSQTSSPSPFGGSQPAASVAVRGASTSPDDAVGSSDATYFLSDDQARCLALVEELASKRGYTVHTIDVGKANRLEQFVLEHLRGVDTFPVLIAPSGGRVVGVAAFTEESVAELMPTEMRSQRAFTYLKVRGGDLDRIRELALNLPEVKEMHFLTGDWDIFVVLEFPSASTNKRQILDFVTDRIRGIPEVLDTSTLVPEYSVTKFL